MDEKRTKKTGSNCWPATNVTPRKGTKGGAVEHFISFQAILPLIIDNEERVLILRVIHTLLAFYLVFFFFVLFFAVRLLFPFVFFGCWLVLAILSFSSFPVAFCCSHPQEEREERKGRESGAAVVRVLHVN